MCYWDILLFHSLSAPWNSWWSSNSKIDSSTSNCRLFHSKFWNFAKPVSEIEPHGKNSIQLNMPWIHQFRVSFSRRASIPELFLYGRMLGQRWLNEPVGLSNHIELNNPVSMAKSFKSWVFFQGNSFGPFSFIINVGQPDSTNFQTSKTVSPIQRLTNKCSTVYY